MSTKAPTTVFNRVTKQLETEQIYGERWLRWIYENPVGKCFLALLVRRVLFSKIMGFSMNRRRSARKVLPFIIDYNIDCGELAKNPLLYTTFNEFFSRALKPEARPLADTPAVLPADGRHLVFPDLSQVTGIYVKGQTFNLDQLLGTSTHPFVGGSMLISRLCPTDYHRFHFPCDGTPSTPTLINGPLYSVHPIALKKNISYLTQNKRQVTYIETPAFGQIAMLEVGATSVGSISNLYPENRSLPKGALKGYFSFGGSCVITLFQKNKIQFSEDLLQQSAQFTETYAKFGTPLGTPTT